jgi:hypothetical protein
MRFLVPGYQFGSNERWTLGTLAVVALYIATRAVFPTVPPLIRCPWHQFLGLDCPGCGITRATMSLLHLHPLSAIEYNPLIVFVAPFVAYRITALLVGALTGRFLVANWPLWFVQMYQWGFIIGMGILGAWRVSVWCLH